MGVMLRAFAKVRKACRGDLSVPSRLDHRFKYGPQESAQFDNRSQQVLHWAGLFAGPLPLLGELILYIPNLQHESQELLRLRCVQLRSSNRILATALADPHPIEHGPALPGVLHAKLSRIELRVLALGAVDRGDGHGPRVAEQHYTCNGIEVLD